MQVKSKTINRSLYFGGHLNRNWSKYNLLRFKPSLTQAKMESKDPTKSPFLNTLDVKNLLGLEKITLHTSSGKLLSSPANLVAINLAFGTLGLQVPTQIHSKKSVAGFKLSRGALLGAKSTLRGISAYEFFYKLYYLGAEYSGSDQKKSSTLFKQRDSNYRRMKPTSTDYSSKRTNRTLPLGIKNVFAFPELDMLDYETFSTLPGFEIHLDRAAKKVLKR